MMGRYANIDTSIYSIFGLSSWTAEGIKTYPANYVAINAGTEYIKVSVIPNGSSDVNLRSSSGVLIVDIFVAAGNGPKRSSAIADKLDDYLLGKTITPTTKATVQLGTSSVEVFGPDPDNPSLYRTSYTIPFNYFEGM
jgi:hypothetical protein